MTRALIAGLLMVAGMLSACASTAAWNAGDDDTVIAWAEDWHEKETRGTASYFPGMPDENGVRTRIRTRPDWEHASVLRTDGGPMLVVTSILNDQDPRWIRRLIIEISGDGSVTEGYLLSLMIMTPPDNDKPAALVREWHESRSFATGDVIVFISDARFQPRSSARFIDGENIGGTPAMPAGRDLQP